jgi:acetate kinase
MADVLLVLNAGSSSLKFAVFAVDDPPRPLVRGQLEGLLTRPRFVARDGTAVIDKKEWPPNTHLEHRDAVRFLFGWGRDWGLRRHQVAGVAHRVVHGGPRFVAPLAIDSENLAELESLSPLAPLHLPHNLAAIRIVAEMAPAIRQVACFDTAFHHTQPPLAQMFALPRRYADEGVRRYGFHGLSYEYIASVLARTDPRAAEGRTVVAHLGNGASMCALRGGRSIACTMSFTALDGLVMGTRCGSIDPGVLLYLLNHHHMSPAALQHLLYEESGLLGVSGISSDMRELLASDDPHATEAVNLFVYRITHELGSLAADLGGVDALVFTGGIGEHAVAIRERVCRDARWLGLELDEQANAANRSRVSRVSSRISAWVIPTDEELMMAQHTRRVLGLAPADSPSRVAAG